MVDYRTFSALRLGGIFPAEILQAYPFYVELDPQGDFDTEYMGGQWHEELIDGVKFFFPASAGDKLGVVELWGSGCVAGAARDKSDSPSVSLVPAWVANSDRVLGALEVPVRMGSDDAAVQALAAGRVVSFDYPVKGERKGAVRSLTFACRAPDVYHIKAVVHAKRGLLKLEMRCPDLVRSNDASGGYDAFFSGLHDEGTGGKSERRRTRRRT
jgi:hypothetical protein